MDVFESKVRRVGSSLGVLIPKESTKKSRLREGLNVKLAIIEKDLKLVEKLFGSVKAQAFRREHSDRVI